MNVVEELIAELKTDIPTEELHDFYFCYDEGEVNNRIEASIARLQKLNDALQYIINKDNLDNDVIEVIWRALME